VVISAVFAGILFCAILSGLQLSTFSAPLNKKFRASTLEFHIWRFLAILGGLMGFFYGISFFQFYFSLPFEQNYLDLASHQALAGSLQSSNYYNTAPYVELSSEPPLLKKTAGFGFNATVDENNVFLYQKFYLNQPISSVDLLLNAKAMMKAILLLLCYENQVSTLHMFQTL
jgi:hypothetical protein